MNRKNEPFMQRAIDLSRQGFPAPNPRVGCVIVKDNKIVGEGYHDHAGAPHAEVMALADAGASAQGADLYCTLEPCNHQGRTPPCSDAIIKAKVKNIFVAERDPNPIAIGGIDKLSAAGVICESALLAEKAREVNIIYMTAMSRKRPYVTAKSATTADNFIARKDGTSKWITGEEAREAGHKLRAELGCVLVGRKTVELDDPQLTARNTNVKNQPLRVVLDANAVLSEKTTLFTDGGNTLRIVSEGRKNQDRDIEIPYDNGFDLTLLLQELMRRGVIGVLVEGGGETVASFLRAGLVDRIEKFVSKETFGEGRFWLGENPPEIQMKKLFSRQLGEDTHESYRVINPDNGT